jgi:hypothetical protein
MIHNRQGGDQDEVFAFDFVDDEFNPEELHVLEHLTLRVQPSLRRPAELRITQRRISAIQQLIAVSGWTPGLKSRAS